MLALLCLLRLPVLLSPVPVLLTDGEKSKALSSLPGLFDEVLCEGRTSCVNSPPTGIS